MAKGPKKAADQPAGAKAPAGNDNVPKPAPAPAALPRIHLFSMIDDEKKLERKVFMSRDGTEISMSWKGGEVKPFKLADAKIIAGDYIEAGHLHGTAKRATDFSLLTRVMIALLVSERLREESRKIVQSQSQQIANLTRDVQIARDDKGPRKKTSIFK